ncbi:ABC transporter substrate-binding protein [Kineococcus sp. SYSU DK006]|uniref:ABC transporter substrate-binding protein n=1 Tax=Kineococcus sp. SYSU DK006 TaxID=3383127 RepID=UPI003D7EEAFA
MPHHRPTAATALTAAAAAVALLLGGCTATSADAPGPGPGDGFPLTVRNCGAEVVLQAPPQRVVLLKSAAVPFLHELGVLDRAVARAGRYPAQYYDEATLAELADVPLLTDATDTSGHLRISREVVLAQRPDLVLGEAEGLDRATLQASGIPLLEEPALCGDEEGGAAGFETVARQLELYGRVFDRPEAARTAADALRARVEAVTSSAAGGAPRSAAVLYPTVGGGVVYAYGAASTATPQLAAAGLRNVFADVGDRVFEVSREELLARDPQVLVLLHGDGDPRAVQEAVTTLPGADRITAVREGEVLVQLFNFTEPATPLAVEGLERLAARFPAVPAPPGTPATGPAPAAGAPS